MIPKIIHQIWVGPNRLPDICLKYIDSIKKHNPDYSYRLWTNENLPQLPANVSEQFNLYGRLQKWAFQADVLRYYIINLYGGVYMDTDFECFQALPITEEYSMFVCKPNLCGHWITNCIFGSISSHPVLEKIIKEMKREPYHGPIFFSNELKKYFGMPIGKTTSLDIFGATLESHQIKVFEPITFFSKNPKHNRCAYHHAHASWVKRK